MYFIKYLLSIISFLLNHHETKFQSCLRSSLSHTMFSHTNTHPFISIDFPPPMSTVSLLPTSPHPTPAACLCGRYFCLSVSLLYINLSLSLPLPLNFLLISYYHCHSGPLSVLTALPSPRWWHGPVLLLTLVSTVLGCYSHTIFHIPQMSTTIICLSLTF